MSGKRASTGVGALQGSSDDELTFKGVIYREREQERFEAVYWFRGTRTPLGFFFTAEEAARAYDDAVRKMSRRVVNFPRPGTDEVQAVKGEPEEVTLRRAAGELPPPRSGPLPPDPGYKGICVKTDVRTAAVFRAALNVGGKITFFSNFCIAEEAARAYDNAAWPGTNEVQAVKGEMDELTLKRHAAEQSAGGAGAAGGITSRGMPAPPGKRRAVAPPPSQPLRKRAAASAETHATAAVKLESPAAPPPAPYTRRPPHRIDTAAWPPPDEALGAASGVKMETRAAAVKTEPPVAPTVAGSASPAPPPASLKAPAVKHEDTTAVPAAPAAAVKTEDLVS